MGGELKPNITAPEKVSVKEQKEGKIVRVLLAEDNDALRGMYKENLEAMGYEVEAVANGLLLLNKLKTSKFDVVVTDNEMPIMTGIDALKDISLIEGTKPRVIIITLNCSPEIRKEIEKYGGVYISKSQAPNGFYEEIGKVIEKIDQPD